MTSISSSTAVTITPPGALDSSGDTSYDQEVAAAEGQLVSLQSDFEAKYQYTILGQEDSVFSDVAGATNTSTTQYTAIQNDRTDETLAIDRINASSADDDTKLKQTAVANIDFVSSSITNIGQVISAATPGDGSSDSIATAIGTLADHLQQAADTYAQAVSNGSVDPTKDTGFANALKSARFQLLQLSIQLQPLLAADNQVFNTNIYDLNSQLNDILNTANQIQSGGTAAATTADTSSGTQGVDITV